MHQRWIRASGAFVLWIALGFDGSYGDQAAGTHLPAIVIRRSAETITVDGDLSDPGWRGASEVRTWFEINPGDNVEPKVENVHREGGP